MIAAKYLINHLNCTGLWSCPATMTRTLTWVNSSSVKYDDWENRTDTTWKQKNRHHLIKILKNILFYFFWNWSNNHSWEKVDTIFMFIFTEFCALVCRVSEGIIVFPYIEVIIYLQLYDKDFVLIQVHILELDCFGDLQPSVPC